MKKLILSLFFILFGINYIYAEPTDMHALGENTDGTYKHRVTSTGLIRNEVGITLESGAVFTHDAGFVAVTDVFNDVPASDTTSVFNTNIATATLVAGTTIFTGGITSPIIPMNVVVFSSATTGVYTTSDISGTMTITGLDGRGEAQTEDITVSSNSATGNCAWSSITSLTFSSFTNSVTDAVIMVGIGTKLGLSNAIAASGDVICAYLDDSGTTSNDDGTVSTTYNTWTPDTAGDGAADVYTIRYKVRSR